MSSLWKRLPWTLTDADIQTPVSLCRAIIARLDWVPGELVLEPCRGTGNFYNNLPSTVHKDWCEIEQGRDFFVWRWPIDTILTNPPFNEVSRFVEHSLKFAQRRVIFLVNHGRLISILKPDRLERWERQGWYVGRPVVYSVKQWNGPYFLLTWTKNGQRQWDWDATVYG